MRAFSELRRKPFYLCGSPVSFPLEIQRGLETSSSGQKNIRMQQGRKESGLGFLSSLLLPTRVGIANLGDSMMPQEEYSHPENTPSSIYTLPTALDFETGSLMLRSSAYDFSCGAPVAHAPWQWHTHIGQGPWHTQAELTRPGFPVCNTRLSQRREARCSSPPTRSWSSQPTPGSWKRVGQGEGAEESPGVLLQLQPARVSLAHSEYTHPPPAPKKAPTATALSLAGPIAARPGLRNKGWHRGGASRDHIGSILAFHSSLLCPSEIILTLR